MWLRDSSCDPGITLPVRSSDVIQRWRGGDCLVPPLHLCYGSEAGAEEQLLAWFDRALSADSALLGAVAAGDEKVVLTPSHVAFS